jgi:CubicO group peptidase (beta-lactamase class C family)
MQRRNVALFLAVFALASCVGTRQGSLYPLPGGYKYSVPRVMDDGLETGSIEDALFTPEQMLKLDAFFGRLKEGTFGEIHGILLVHKGRLVLEEYFPGFRFKGGKTDFSASDLHHLASVTKSLTSLCVGIAVDKGYIKSIDQPFLDYYTDVSVPDRQSKQGITIRNLLTMTDGLQWDEATYPYTDLRNDIVQFYISADPLRFILARKALAPPGSRWLYNGACPNFLGDIIYRASGYKLDRFAKEFLYTPLSIITSPWITLNGGFIYASGDAELRPRDMAKIGMLVLNGGTWKGERVVSSQWLAQSMQKSARADLHDWYGFLWWLPILDEAASKRLGPVFMASGWGGQYIIIVPNRDLVLTGGNYDYKPGTISIVTYILDTFFMTTD